MALALAVIYRAAAADYAARVPDDQATVVLHEGLAWTFLTIAIPLALVAANLLDGGAPFYAVYECADGKWVGVSTSADSVAARVMDLLGVGDDPRFSSFEGRVEHRTELERQAVGSDDADPAGAERHPEGVDGTPDMQRREAWVVAPIIALMPKPSSHVSGGFSPFASNRSFRQSIGSRM